jgi:predicted nucleic acid-binding protein
MIEYLLDSGFLYADIDRSDRQHEAVSSITKGIRGKIILPVPAITETTYFISINLGVEHLAKFLESLGNSKFFLETPTSEDYVRSAEILRKYNDANLDFVDACIFAMAERLNITKILTIDRRHFGLFRPNHCDTFEILP